METSANVDPSLFLHVRVVLSVVVSLSIAKLLTGLALFVQHPGRRKPYGIHLLWVFSTLLLLVHFWWWQFGLSHLQVWRFETYAFILCYAILNYLLCAVLSPDDLAEYGGYRDYFLSRRGWFFGLLALSFLADIADSRLKGADYLAQMGTEYLVRVAAGIVLCVAAAIVRNEKFHAAFAVGNLAYQVSWILRTNDLMR